VGIARGKRFEVAGLTFFFRGGAADKGADVSRLGHDEGGGSALVDGDSSSFLLLLFPRFPGGGETWDVPWVEVGRETLELLLDMNRKRFVFLGGVPNEFPGF